MENESKCKIMHFCHHNAKHSPPLNEQIQEISRSEKDLGENIDDKLNLKFRN